MTLRSPPRPSALVAAELFGMTLYLVLGRTGSPAVLASDAGRGVWVGVCLGLEVWGVALVAKARTGRGA